ncbi:hypothetical protein PROFUN_02976 [Planoprotostelium fungivorum]|uniref:LamG-like jellyroll fold domain-containing protein n=1 Tax=Planoprotostelium fungivorum TaxID=1890364 RepID=A0A2P6NX76_9EUKA|nr:hypothetical protein PROFUN_02976 [Planoprotostelium fungivorum]
MKRAVTLLLLALFSSAWATCQSGYSYCPGINSCYDPTQYSCDRDQFNNQYRLCAAGTVSCNDVCIASCAYQCAADGSYYVKNNRTCPPPPTCLNSNTFACGAACYDKSRFCCISGQPQDTNTCPQPTSSVCDSTSTCPFGLYNVGSLADGQLRLNFGPGAFSVNFTLRNGNLFDQRGFQCYISSSGQLQCDRAPQTAATSFCLSGDFLSRNGNLVWYSCAVGTGGSNLYTTNIDSVACSATYLYVTPFCPPTPPPTSSTVAPTTSTVAPTSSTKAPTTSTVAPTSSTKAPTSSTVAPTTSTVAPTTKPTTQPSTTSYVPTTTYIPPTTAPCVPGGVVIPVPYCYFSFDFEIFGGLLKDDSGKGRHGTCLGQPKKSEGRSKFGLNFDFSLGFQGVRVDQTSGLKGDFSIATWLKISENSEKTMKIVSTKSGLFSLLTGWELTLCPKTKTVTFVSGFSSVSWNIDFSVNAWFHIAFSAEKSGKVTLYINGVAGVSQYISLSKCGSALYIASDKGNCNFKGSFDDFLLFDICISIREVLAIINNRCDTTTTAQISSTTKLVTSSQLPPSTTSKVTPPPTQKPPKKCGLPWLYWSFDKTKEGKCSDDSGHGRHGWFSEEFSLVPGKLRQACNWKRNNNLHISLSQCDLHKSFTIAAWIKLDVINGKNIIASTKSLLTGWELAYDGQGKSITFTSSLGSSVSWDASSISLGVWVHVAISIDVTRAELYLNGNSCGSKSIAACSSSFIGLSVGGKIFSQPLLGAIDEFLLFDRALDREEVCDARDKYQTGTTVEQNNWSKQSNSNDWGAGWELGVNLSLVGLNRLNNWWIF